jgi:hypothetical protein
VPFCVWGLKVVKVIWGVDLYNVSCIDWYMRSSVCYGYFEKNGFVNVSGWPERCKATAR